MNDLFIIFGSKDKDFNEYEIIDKFHEWFIEMNNRRLTKKGKLFEFSVSIRNDSASIIFGNNQIFSGSGFGEDLFEYIAMVQKVKYLIVKCIELANELAVECNVEIEKYNFPDVPTTIRYSIVRK